MKIGELIGHLSLLPPSLDVIIPNAGWEEYDEVSSIKTLRVLAAYEKTFNRIGYYPDDADSQKLHPGATPIEVVVLDIHKIR
jgi:hypothetical protein